MNVILRALIVLGMIVTGMIIGAIAALILDFIGRFGE